MEPLSINADSPTVSTTGNPAPLESILCTGELKRRPFRAPDYATESHALVALARSLADAPSTILQTLAEKILEVLKVGSAGVSLLTENEEDFFWPAIAGEWQRHIGGGTPRNFGPCGDVLDCNAPLLFKRLERRYAYFELVTPRVEESLLVPFFIAGKAVGTIWAIAHDARRKFDAEDLRQLENLGRFASVAYQAQTMGAREQSRAALKIEDAAQSGRALEKLNAELRASEEALQCSESDLRDFVEHAAVGLHWVGPDGIVLWANQTELDLLGYSREEYFGKSITQFHADQPVIEDILARLTGGETLRDHEARLRRKDGSIVHVLINSNVLFKNGEFVHTRCFTRDVTEQKMAESTLRASEEFNRSIIENSPDCIKVLDLDGKLLSMLSGQELLGIDDIAPFLNKSWIDFWAGEDRVAAQAAVEAAAAGTKGSFVGFFRTLRGIPKWWDVAVTPIVGANGKPCRLLSVSRDVTQRKRAEMNLAFLATISHDLVLWASVEEMMSTVGAKLAAYFGLSLCAFAEIDETAEQVVINHDWHRNDVPGLVGTHRLADFVGDEFIRVARSGEAIVVRDTAKDARTTDAKFAALKIASFICMPLIREEQWRFALCLYHSEPHNWRDDEIELTRELTTRIWTRLERLRAETALRRNERRLRDAMDSARLTFVEVDLEHGSAWTADNFPTVMGYAAPPGQTTDVLIGTRALLEHIVPGDRLRVQAALDDFTGGKPVGRIDYQVLGDDQIARWIESKWSVELGADGRPLKSFATNLDVTERKLAEAALRESDQRYRTLFNTMDEGYCIIEMIFDEHNKPVDYLYLDANSAFGKLTGMRDVVGKRISELIPDLEAHWFDIFGSVALTGEAQRFVNEVKPLSRWFDVYAFQFGGPQSHKVAAIFSEITERIKTAEALRQSEARFRALFNRGPIAMYSCDVSGKTQEYNSVAAALWGMEPTSDDTDERFRGAFKFYLPDGTPIAYGETPMTKVLRGESPDVSDMEVIFERPDGSRVNVIANIVPLKNDQGEITGVLNCFYDITERSRLEKKTLEQAATLAELNTRKDEFLAMLSHELRNPLAPISNAVQLLRLQKNEDPVQQRAHGIIERQVGQLTHLIDDLMEVSRLTTGRIHLRIVHVTMNAIIKNAVETIRPMIDAQRHTLDIAVSAEPILLNADAARIEQVVVNLLTNAAKYTEPGGRIWLTALQEGDEAVVRVRDNGVGISPELLPRVFDLFTQADRSMDRSQGGLGIGLCLVQRLVEMHRGTVTAHSTLSEGSEFVVRIPVVQSSALSPASQPIEAASRSETLRVLVVDDSVDAAETLTMLLQLSGHEVRTVHDGLAGVEAALEYAPHVVLLDIGLPGMNGFDVAKRLRQESTLANVVLVAMTGYGEAAARQRSREAGFDHHLVKPADFEKVEAILAGMVKSHA